MALSTVDKVKAYLGLDPGDDNSTAMLQTLLDQESAAFEARTGRDIEAADYTEAFDGTGDTEHLLVNYPVISVASLTVDGEAVAAATALGDGYEFEPTSGLLRLRGSYFTTGMRNCTCVYRAGYATVPADVEAAVIQMVADAYKRPKRIGVMSESIGGESISYQTLTLPESVSAIIEAYRRFA